MRKNNHKGELRLTAGVVTVVLVVSVILTAVFLTLALFSRQSDIVLDVKKEAKTGEREMSLLEIISPYEQQTLVELQLKNQSGTLIFQPDQQGRWQLKWPEIHYQNQSSLEENLFLLTNLQGQPLSALLHKNLVSAGQNKEVLPQDFSKSDYRLTYRNVDGSAKSLSFLRVPNQPDQLFACYEGETDIWLVKGLSHVLQASALDYLDPHLFARNPESIKNLSFQREEDGLLAEIERLQERPENDQDSAWGLRQPVLMRGNRYNLDALISELLDLEAARYISLGRTDLDRYGLDQPAYAFELNGTDQDEDYADEILLAKPKNGQIYGYSSYQDAIFLCGSGSIQLAESDLLDLIDRYPIRIPFATVKSVIVEAGRRKMILMRAREVSADDFSPILSSDISWFYNGQLLTEAKESETLSLRHFYRSLSQIYVTGFAPDLPDEPLEIQCSIFIEGTDRQIKLELKGEKEGPLYLFIDSQYTGLYCDWSVLNREDKDNCGILLALDLLAEQVAQAETD